MVEVSTLNTDCKSTGELHEGCLYLLVIVGIQMDADTDHGCHERIMLLCVYEHAVQAVIIEDAVVDTFRGGTLVIDLL